MATGQAIVCEIANHIPIEGKDRIVSSHIFGENIIIGKQAYPVGTKGILVDCESVLDKELCSKLNLFRHSDLNVDKTKAGYIDDNARIRAMKMSGKSSTGLFISVKELENIGLKIGGLNIGTQLNEYNGTKICNKYVRKIKVGGKGPAKLKKNICPSFHEHVDTNQIMRCMGELQELSTLTITSKLHGCSMRCGLLPVENESWFRRILQKFWNISNFDYRFVVGSRRVLKYIDGVKLTKKQASFYETDIWTKAAKEHFYGKLNKGETVYCELVGYENGDKTIMPIQDSSKLKKFLDKESYKEYIDYYGEKTSFVYGCKPGEYKLYVYRITQSNEDGESIDLTWPQVMIRCEELDVKHVKEIRRLILDESIDKRDLSDYIEETTEQHDKDFPHQLTEGIVIRMDYGNKRPKFYKNKGFNFKVIESIIRDNDEYVDIEDNN